MSLQVWLPLTKDLRQQGLDNISITTNTGATFVSNGKLGGCYSFDSVDDWIQGTFDKTKYSGKPMSLACWFKTDKSDAGGAIIDLAADLCLGYTYNSSGIKFTAWRCYKNSSNNRVGSSSVTSTYYNADDWHHIVETFEGGVEKIYVDGILSQTFDHTNLYTYNWTPLLASNYNKISIGKSAGDSNWIGGLVNDVRIYDHCLSPMEVKELAKGLVLHYPLSSADLINRSTITHGYYLDSNGAEGGDNGWCHTDYIGLIPNSSYIGIGLSAGGANTYAVLYNKDKVLTRTVLLTANQNLSITTSDTEYFIRLSIRKYVNELNTTAKFLYIGTTEYDCSGFCNNGTRTGTFSWISDTPKYQVSTSFNGSNYIGLVPPDSEIQTVAFWVKWSSIPSTQTIGFIDDGSGLAFGLSYGNIIVSCQIAGAASCYDASVLSANNWYHIVVIKTGTDTRKLYINAIEQTANSSSNYWSYINNELQIGKRKNTNEGITGWMSDFRMYATALSTDEIQSLYQNSAYIDSGGNIYGIIHE